MSDAELAYLRERAELGDEQAAARLVELAGDRADAYQLQALAESGVTEDMGEHVQVAAEQGDLHEVRRLAARGDPDAADVVDELYYEDPSDDGT
jgi:hypothetical protein